MNTGASKVMALNCTMKFPYGKQPEWCGINLTGVVLPDHPDRADTVELVGLIGDAARDPGKSLKFLLHLLQGQLKTSAGGQSLAEALDALGTLLGVDEKGVGAIQGNAFFAQKFGNREVLGKWSKLRKVCWAWDPLRSPVVKMPAVPPIHTV